MAGLLSLSEPVFQCGSPSGRGCDLNGSFYRGIKCCTPEIYTVFMKKQTTLYVNCLLSMLPAGGVSASVVKGHLGSTPQHPSYCASVSLPVKWGY